MRSLSELGLTTQEGDAVFRAASWLDLQKPSLLVHLRQLVSSGLSDALQAKLAAFTDAQLSLLRELLAERQRHERGFAGPHRGVDPLRSTQGQPPTGRGGPSKT